MRIIRRIWRFIVAYRYPYRGGGVLLISAGHNGLYALLGRRNSTIRCLRVWSIIGGGMEASDNRSYKTAALRELEQEVERGDIATAVAEVKAGNCLEITFNYVFFRWKTYVVLVKQQDIGPVRLNHEFSTCGWFPLADLPHPLHLFLRPPFQTWRRIENWVRSTSGLP